MARKKQSDRILLPILILIWATLLEAARLAAVRCGSWSFATSNERYDAEALLTLAETGDDEDPIDAGSFYVVSPAGAIGLCVDGGDIDWLFLADAAPNEELPTTHEAAPPSRFCSKCGAPVIPGARFAPGAAGG